jgi:hypothetical protein
MHGKHILIALSVAAAMAAVAVVVSAGNPSTPPGPPESTYSHTLEDIYNRLDTGAAATPIPFTEPVSGPGTGTMHTLDEIYDLVGARAFVPKTGQTISYAAGDDGHLEMGVDWITNTRFITSTTGVVTDTLTGLVWLQDANCTDTIGSIIKSSGVLSWTAALTWSNNLESSYCGLSDGSSAGDWRLPNVRELQSLIDYGEYNPPLPDGHPFTNVQPTFYWSSTTGAGNPDFALHVYMVGGRMTSERKTTAYHVWPVRGGQ